MSPMSAWLEEALRRVNVQVRSPNLEVISPDTDVYEIFDSLAIVDLLLETEAVLEKELGRYVSLADETIFDATKTPLRRWSDWVTHVERRHAS